ncbi:MAG: Mevalonate kinase [Myxococcaceae bacterium]|nr:Mevalonate kinase [Myxococcaceae bacterium]
MTLNQLDALTASFGHGKVILLGEHSVVHGRPALALSVERGAEVTVAPSAGAATTLHIEPWNVAVDSGSETNLGREPLQQALKVARAFYPDEVELALHATMRLPSGAGMGSSAALGVAVLRALDQARGLTRSNEEIYQRSLDWERVFHGNPSGVDNAMATHGGMALFKKGEPLTRVVPRHPISLVVAYSGSSSSTKLMVDSVARQFEKEPERIGKVFDAIAAIVSNGKLALEQGELKDLGQLMTMNHKLLSGMMLSTDALEEMIAAAMAAGALGAKVTGAGGGGCMVALADSAATKRAVSDALKQLGKTVYDVESGS